MKINQGLGILGPALIRRKIKNTKRPPWFVEVPPDTVDIALLPRINRYERGGLKFRSLGSTQQKFADRLAVFRDTMGEVPPGLAHSETQMREGLEDVMYERLRLLEEAELQSQRKYGLEATDHKVKLAEDASSAKVMSEKQEALTETNETVPVQNIDLNDKKLISNAKQESSVKVDHEKSASKETESEPPLQGIPTDWLVRRLESMQRQRD